MTLLDALAAAARDCLLDGRVAPLPGIGTLARAHVSARIQAGADGTRVLLPPGAAVGLSTRAADPTGLAQALVRHTGAPAEAGAGALRDAVDQLEARLAVTGEVRLPGVGAFQRTSGGIRFAADPDLLAAINRPYKGLVPVAVAPVAVAPVAVAPVAVAPAPAPAVERIAEAPAVRAAPRPLPAEESGAVDILLDLIVNEPPEAVEPEPVEPEPVEPEPVEPEPVEPDRTAVGPSESAFVDEEDETTDDRSVSFESLPDHTEVPEAATGDTASPRRHAAEWHAGPAPEATPRPLDTASDGIEDAEYHVAPPLAAPPERDEPDADLRPDPSSEPLIDRPPEHVADPRPSPGPDVLPVPEQASEASAVREAPPASHRSAWAAFYAALVLVLAALLLWWTLDERRADPPSVVGTAAVLALPL